MSNNTLPKILVTGASGFIGQYFLDKVKNKAYIFAVSRRLPVDSYLYEHDNIEWIQTDISESKPVQELQRQLLEKGGVDYVLHLAGFYDFNYDENPEYYRTNVVGTQNILDMCKDLNIERFMFSSSVAVCEFPSEGHSIDEESPADAKYAYARTKYEAEQLVKEYSQYFKASVFRFAAVFSDWCEYGPLYIFLNTWLSRNWKNRMIGGKGESAITYIHINCLINFILKVISKSQQLPSFDTFIVSPYEPVSHNELFKLATKYYYGRTREPIHLPKYISLIGVTVMDDLGKLIGKRPFEKPWMIQYIDKKLYIDSKYTRKLLNWKPTDRHTIQRRLLYIIEHMKTYSYEWDKRNKKMSKYRANRPNYQIYEQLELLRDDIIKDCTDTILSPKKQDEFYNYHQINKSHLRKDVVNTFQFVLVAIKTKDRYPALTHARQIAYLRKREGLTKGEVMNAVDIVGRTIYDHICENEELAHKKQELYDEIIFTFRLMIDEIESAFEEEEEIEQLL